MVALYFEILAGFDKEFDCESVGGLAPKLIFLTQNL